MIRRRCPSPLEYVPPPPSPLVMKARSTSPPCASSIHEARLQDNFLTKNLGSLFANLGESEAALAAKAAKFRAYLSAKFRWDFQLEEDAPQIVHLPDQ